MINNGGEDGTEVVSRLPRLSTISCPMWTSQQREIHYDSSLIIITISDHKSRTSGYSCP